MNQSPRFFSPLGPKWAIGLVFAILSILFGGWVARIAEVQSRLGINKTQLGFSLLGMSVGALCMTIISGWLLSRFAPGRAAILSTLTFCVCIVFPTLAWDSWSLMAGLFFVGVGNGFMNVSINAAASVAESNHRISIIPLAHAMYSSGLVAGALIATAMTFAHIPPTTHLALLGLLTGVLCIVLARPALLSLPPTPAPRKIGGIFKPPPSLIGLAAMCGFFTLGEGAIADWSSVYLRTEMKVQASLTGLGYTGFALFMSIGRFNAVSLRRYFGVKRLILMGAVVSILGLVVAIIAPNLPVAMLGFALVGLGLSNIVPSLYAAAGQAPGITPGAGIATAAAAGLIALLIGRPVIGSLGDRFGLAMGLVFIAICLLIGGVICWKYKWPRPSA